MCFLYVYIYYLNIFFVLFVESAATQYIYQSVHEKGYNNKNKINFKSPSLYNLNFKTTPFQKNYPTPIANYFQSRITCSDWLGLFFPITSSISYCPALGAHRHRHTPTHIHKQTRRRVTADFQSLE